MCRTVDQRLRDETVRVFPFQSLLTSHSSQTHPIPCESRSPCQHDHMKQFLLGTFLTALIIPTLSLAQTQQLTEQLGKTVLYGDVALSPTAHASPGSNPLPRPLRNKLMFGPHPATLRQFRSISNPRARGSTPIRRGRPIPRRSRCFPMQAKRTSYNSGHSTPMARIRKSLPV